MTQRLKTPTAQGFSPQPLFFALVLFFYFSPMLYAQPVQDCDDALLQAEEKYFTGYFEESIELIEKCLENGNLAEETKIRSCKLLSLNFLADDNADKATLCIKKLLAMNPDYLPDEEKEPREFVELVYRVKLEIQKSNEKLQDQLLKLQLAQKKTGTEKKVSGGTGKWILLAAATSAVVSTVVVLSMRGNGDDDNNNGNGMNQGRN